MPIDGSGVASPPSGTRAVSGTVIESADANSITDDVYAILNVILPDVGTALSTKATSVATISALAALPAPDASIIYIVRGVSENGDFPTGPLPYYYNATSSMTSDSITYSVVSSAAGGRFIRMDMRNDEYDMFLCYGQSNALGAGPAGTWPTNNQVRVWNGTYNAVGTVATALSPAIRGSAPFASDGSNNFAVHFADAYQRRTGRRVMLVVVAKGGTPLEDLDQIGDSVYDFLRSNITSLLVTYPKAVLKGVLFHQGEANQFSTIATYLSLFDNFKNSLRAETWFPADTPIVVGELYFGQYSASGQWTMNDALSLLPRRDQYVGLASSIGLEATDEGFLDSYPAAYRVHFNGDSLVSLGKRYLAEYFAVKNGNSNPPRFDIVERVSGVPSYLHVAPIVVAAAGTLNLTVAQLVQWPHIKCSGAATINLPNINTATVSSWVRALTYKFTIFCNSNAATVTIATGTTDTISIGDNAPATSVSIVNSRAPVEFTYYQDTRWRGIKSAN